MFKYASTRLLTRPALANATAQRRSPIATTYNQIRTMSTSDEKDKITSWASKDGSFKRQTSAFRDSIEKGGKFEPEKGEYRWEIGGEASF
jgi:hypothetical protein